MSTSGAAAGRPQRSSSLSRSSRRSTMSIGPGVGSLLEGGSLSPQRAVRTRVLREKETNSSGGDAAGTKPKPATKAAAKGSSTRTQHMQYAFGSKVVKPASARTGMGAAAAGDVRGRTQTTVALDAGGGATARPRLRDRSARNEAHEQRGASRVRASTSSHHPQPLAAKLEETGAAHILKAQLEEKEATIAALKSKLERNASEGTGGVANDKGARAATTPAPTDVKQDDGTDGSKQRDLNVLAQGSLTMMQKEALAEVEEALVRVEAVAAAGLSRTEEMQNSVDDMIRILKARR